MSIKECCMIFQYTSHPYKRFITSYCTLLIFFIYNHTSAYATTNNLKLNPSETITQRSKHTSQVTTPTYQPSKSIWSTLWGTAAPEPRLTLGMWSAHATKKKRNNKNDMIGISYYGLGVGTFVNSYY